MTGSGMAGRGYEFLDDGHEIETAVETTKLNPDKITLYIFTELGKIVSLRDFGF